MLPRNHMPIECKTEKPSGFPHVLTVRTHSFRADVDEATGGTDSAPDAHDYFDASLAACKALTATWYARKQGIPLERMDVRVERDASEERAGKYLLKVKFDFHGPMDDEQRAKLHSVVARCPVHKLMTTTEITIETAPLDARE
jgi:putative redox protein